MTPNSPDAGTVPDAPIAPWPAPCRRARRLMAMAAAATLLFSLAIVADLFCRTPRQTAAAGQWIRALCLSGPALWPSGSPLRHPETVHPGVDLRFAPGSEAAP